MVVGEGPLLNRTIERVKRKGLSYYVRFIPATDKPEEIYAISDLTINCSIKEGLALTSYESLSMGVPVISSDVGGQRELIDETTGALVKCHQDEMDYYNTNYSKEEINEFAQGIVRIQNSINDYKNNCREKILDGFTIDRMVENMSREFSSLITRTEDEEYDTRNNSYKELINQYFVQDENNFSWLCSEYNRKVYSEDNKKPLIRRVKNYIKRRLWRK